MSCAGRRDTIGGMRLPTPRRASGAPRLLASFAAYSLGVVALVVWVGHDDSPWVLALAVAVMLGLAAMLLLSVGLNDERVSPWMSAKLAARLLDRGAAVDVRTDRAGHGMTASPRQIAARVADIWTFFAQHLS